MYKARVLDPIKPALIVPEVVDPSRWWRNGEFNYSDDERKYIFSYNGELQPYFCYNTKLVSPNEVRSYWDLLNPNWKGKMVMVDPAPGPAIATPLRRLLTEMDLTGSRDMRQITDWLATGKFSLCIGCQDTQRAKGQGLPVDTFHSDRWKEGGSLTSSFGSLSFLNNAPHPNAAKVFINWFLSRNGQIALQKIGRPSDPPNSRRIDIPKDDVPDDRRFVSRGRYLDVTRPEWQDMTPIFKLVREIMAGREKR